jgi:two-component system, NtrC family, response regulator AlgB
MQQLFESAKRAAHTDGTIMLVGESGVGKSLLATQIHRWSPRSAKSFLTLECYRIVQQDRKEESAVTMSSRGLFISKNGKPANLEEAEGGTIYLSGVDGLSASLQLELAQFLQKRSFEAADGERPVNIRTIAATNHDLFPEIRAHRFREDLYYDLNIISLRVPPLRERPSDILPLAVYLLASAAIRHHRGTLQLSNEAAAAIVSYNWPGNLRELGNAMEAAAVLAQNELVMLSDLPQTISEGRSDNDTTISPKTNLNQLELEHIKRVLQESDTLQKAAEILGINVSTLWRKRRLHNLDHRRRPKPKKTNR